MGNSKSPSRRRYEEANPTVSFRISKGKKDELDELVDDLEITKKEWFESVIDDERGKFSAVFQQGKTKGEQQGYEKGHAKGYDEGFDDAYDEMVATVPCIVCGEAVAVNTDQRQKELYDTIKNINYEWTSRPPLGTLECDIQHRDCHPE